MTSGNHSKHHNLQSFEAFMRQPNLLSLGWLQYR